jgi:hypothetical protein
LAQDRSFLGKVIYMMAWDRAPVKKSGLAETEGGDPAGVLYQLALAFPSWAGILLAAYALFLAKFNAFRIGLR